MPDDARQRQAGAPADASRARPRAMIWDLDGTLSDDQARAHFV
ncbi:MAG TPA: hypothetical protein VHG93_11120 [Longimicrobium sp.]|nr:hypothetical protein [Longimicrobium sp.]